MKLSTAGLAFLLLFAVYPSPYCFPQDIGINTTINVPTGFAPSSVQCNPVGSGSNPNFSSSPGTNAARHLIAAASFQFSGQKPPSVLYTPGPTGNSAGAGNGEGFNAGSQYPDPLLQTGFDANTPVFSWGTQLGTSIPVLNLPSPVGLLGNSQGNSPADFNRQLGKDLGADPVNPFNGEFTMRERDLYFPGIGMNFGLVRTYRSRWDYDGPIGYGWDHSFNQRLVFDSKALPYPPQVSFLTGGATVIQFTLVRLETGQFAYRTPAGVHLTLQRGANKYGGQWTLTGPGGLTKSFDANGLLTNIADLNGNTIAVTWEPSVRTDKFRVLEIVDTIGHKHRFSYSGSGARNAGLLLAVESIGTGERVDYEIDDNHDLRRAKVAGAGATYTYSSPQPDENVLTDLEAQQTCEAACGSADIKIPGGQCDQAPQYAQTQCESACGQNRTQCMAACTPQCPSLCNSADVQACQQRCKDSAQDSCAKATEQGCSKYLQDVGGNACNTECSDTCSRSCPNISVQDLSSSVYFTECLLEFKNPAACGWHAASNDCRACCEYGEYCHGGCSSHNCGDTCKSTFMHGSTGTPCATKFEGCVERSTVWCVQHVNMASCNTACGGDCEQACASGCRSGCSHNITCTEECQRLMPPAVTLVKDCRTSCLSACRQKLADAAGVRYGRKQDLGHNLVEIRNADGTLYLTNNYGQDPYSPSYDAVVEQTYGTGGKVKFRYHDLVVEDASGGPKGQDAGLVGRRSNLSPWEPCGFQCSNPADNPQVCSSVSLVANISTRPAALPVSATVVVDRQGLTWLLYFDPQGHVLSAVNSTQRALAGIQGGGILYQYNDNGELIGLQTPYGRRYCQLYDPDGYLKDRFSIPSAYSTGVPAGTVHQWYKWTGSPKRLQDVSDPRDETVVAQHMEWDAHGNLVSISVPQSGIWKFSVDARGRITSTQMPSGAVRRNDYYPANGQVSKIVNQGKAASEEVSFTYDTALNLKSVARLGKGNQQLIWGPGRRLNQVISTWEPVGTQSKLTYTYYLDGRLKTTTDAHTVRTLTYNSEGLISGVTEKELCHIRGKLKCQPKSLLQRAWSIERDSAGAIKKIIYPEGNFVAYDRRTSSDFGPFWTITTSAGGPKLLPQTVQSVFLDLEGMPVGHRDSTGAITRYKYDGLGRLTEVIDALGNERRREYDQAGFLKWEAVYASGAGMFNAAPQLTDDGLTAWTQYEHDMAGRVVKKSVLHATYRQPSGTDYGRKYPWLDAVGTGWLATTYSFDPDQDTVTIQDAGANRTVESYDGFGRPLQTQWVDGSKLTNTYKDPTTVVRMLQGPSGYSFSQTVRYNGIGEPVSVEVAGTQVWSAEYDDRGLPTKHSSAAAGVAITNWDDFARRRSIQVYDDSGLQKLLQSTQFEWDANSRLVAFKDGLNQATVYSYDSLNRPYKTVLADGSRYETLSFRGATRLPVKVLDPNGTAFTYTYDAAGRVKALDVDQHNGPWSGVTTITLDRDPMGRVVKAFTNNNPNSSNDDVTVELRYDTLGNVTREDKVWANPPAGVGWYAEFPARTVSASVQPATSGWTQSIRIGSGTAAIAYNFDQLGRLAAIKKGTNVLAQFTYHLGGLLKESKYASGRNDEIAYDELGRVSAMASNSSGQSDQIYVFYGDDHRSQAFKRTQPGFPALSALFATDFSSRLRIEALAVPDFPPRTPPSRRFNLTADEVAAYSASAADWRKYDLDPADNWKSRTAKDAALVADPAISPINSYLTFAPNDRAVYDPRGALLAYGQESYEYNGLGQLVKAVANGKTIEYTYDALGRLGRRSVNGHVKEYTTYGSSIIGELSLDSETIADITYGRVVPENLTLNDWKGWYRTLYGPGSRPAVRIEGSTGNTYNYHFDPLGSVAAVSNSAGDMVERYAYTAYGETGISNASGSSLSSSSIANPLAYQGQFYDPDARLYLMGARWYRPDWGRFVTMDPIGVAGGQNLYSYAHNAPLRFRDRLGLDPTPILQSPMQSYFNTATSTPNSSSADLLVPPAAPPPDGLRGMQDASDIAITTTGNDAPPEVATEGSGRLEETDPVHGSARQTETQVSGRSPGEELIEPVIALHELIYPLHLAAVNILGHAAATFGATALGYLNIADLSTGGRLLAGNPLQTHTIWGITQDAMNRAYGIPETHTPETLPDKNLIYYWQILNSGMVPMSTTYEAWVADAVYNARHAPQPPLDYVVARYREGGTVFGGERGLLVMIGVSGGYLDFEHGYFVPAVGFVEGSSQYWTAP